MPERVLEGILTLDRVVFAVLAVGFIAGLIQAEGQMVVPMTTLLLADMAGMVASAMIGWGISTRLRSIHFTQQLAEIVAPAQVINEYYERQDTGDKVIQKARVISRHPELN
jgi:hypothetical protein